MSATEHINELLVGYSAGTLPPASALLVASHLAMSEDNRDFVAALDAYGGTLLEDDAGVPLAARDTMIERIFAEDGRVDPVSEPTSLDGTRVEDSVLPLPLRRFLGKRLEDLQWKARMPGLKEFEIDAEEGAHVSLIWVRAGHAMPTHTHEGTEATLVLKGAFRDQTGHYRRGDIAIADDSVDHRPVADKGEDCICFVVLDAPVRLTGPIGRFIQPFLRN